MSVRNEPEITASLTAIDDSKTEQPNSDSPQCILCGYDLRGLGDWPITCPECGVINQQPSANLADSPAMGVFYDARTVGAFAVFSLVSVSFGAPLAINTYGMALIPALLFLILTLRATIALESKLGLRRIWVALSGISYGVIIGVNSLLCVAGAIGWITSGWFVLLLAPALFVQFSLHKSRGKVVKRIDRAMRLTDIK